jgi:putative ABC transport system substrate-binding protein
MRRRDIITLLAGVAGAWTLTARAQQVGPLRLIGVLMGVGDSVPAAQSWLAAFKDELSKLGWREGNNLRIEVRWGAGDPERIRSFAKELIELRPDAILGQTTPVISALAGETQAIPIVFVTVSDPIGAGFAASLAHPGGNVTGFTVDDSALGGKWVELLKEIAPHTVRVALLFNPATAVPIQLFMPSIQAAASFVAIQANLAPVHAKDEIEDIIAAQAHNPGGGLIVIPDVFNVANRELIIALAARYGLPAIYNATLFVRSGGLIAYGADFAEHLRQAARYIDRILNGAKPADLPVQNPTKFELVINLKTAKALGLDVPAQLLVRADEVME